MSDKFTQFEFDAGRETFVKAGVKVVTLIKRFAGWLLSSVTLVILAYVAFSLFFSTDVERRLRREIRMYEKLYPELLEKQELIGDAIAAMQYKDNGVYERIFHSTVPEADPMESLRRLSGRDTIPENRLVLYTLEKADALLESKVAVDAAFDNIFLALSDSSLVLPPMILPLESVTYPQVGASVGSKMNPFYQAYVNHEGLDLIALRGTPVFATSDGVVRQVSRSRMGGIVVEIVHDGGYETAYKHLESASVHAGQTVRAGARIGTVGMSGKSFAPHLHYEVRRNGVPQDPVNYIFASVAPLEYVNMLYVSVNTKQSMD